MALFENTTCPWYRVKQLKYSLSIVMIGGSLEMLFLCIIIIIIRQVTFSNEIKNMSPVNNKISKERFVRI